MSGSPPAERAMSKIRPSDRSTSTAAERKEAARDPASIGSAYTRCAPESDRRPKPKGNRQRASTLENTRGSTAEHLVSETRTRQQCDQQPPHSIPFPILYCSRCQSHGLKVPTSETRTVWENARDLRSPAPSQPIVSFVSRYSPSHLAATAMLPRLVVVSRISAFSGISR